MKFNAVVALFASASALTINKFNYGETALCLYEMNDSGICAPRGTNPETCRTPANIPNNSDCSAFIDETAPKAVKANAASHAQKGKKDDEGTEAAEKKECEYKANDDKTACVLKANMDGCKAPAVVPSKLPDCDDQ